MKKRIFIFSIVNFGLIVSNPAMGQNIQIGQSAEQIKGLIEWSTKNHNKYDSYENKPSSYWSWDVNYYNGQIIEVIQCYQHQYIINLSTVSDYCKHYKMANGKLASIQTQFENISVEKLRRSYDNDSSYKKISTFYFSDDYEHYSKIYLSREGLATIEWNKTIILELPKGIQSIVNSKLTEIKRAKKSKEIETTPYDDEDKIDTTHYYGHISLMFVLAGRKIISHSNNKSKFTDGGKVTMNIIVNRKGLITNSSVKSASNSIIRDLALKELQNIQFNQSPTAPVEQIGNITFEFKPIVK